MTGDVALVTGAAGGIGSAVVRALAAGGGTVAAVDQDKRELDRVARQLREEGLAVRAFPADVTDQAEVAAMVDGVERELGPIGQLVNAAGVLRLGGVRTFTEEDWAVTFAVNTTGVFLVSRTVVDRMVPRERGAVVTIASNAAGVARAGMAAYSASKAAATAFTRCLGLETARHAIRCNVVAPGSTDTGMLRSMWQDAHGAARVIEGDPGQYRIGIPLRRIASPADIADVVGFLLSDRARHITMQTVTVDGGATLGAS